MTRARSAVLLVLAVVAPLRVAAAGRVLEGRFLSAALGVEKRYQVYLPDGYDAPGGARFPVIYLLHGARGDDRRWLEYGRLAQAADQLTLRALVVMPDGDTGYYANWVTRDSYAACVRWKGRDDCTRRQRYEDYVAQDLVAHVDATYRTVADRKARALSGNSMGGYGALAIALRRPDVFSSAASHSGPVALTYAGPHPYREGKGRLATTLAPVERGRVTAPLVKVFGEELGTWRAHDPAVLVEKLKDGALDLYLDCGTEDGFRLQDGAAYVHAVLERRGVRHEFHLLPGAHDWEFWKERLFASLRFHADHFHRAGL